MFNILFFLYISPIILIYLLFCFTLPMLKMGEVKQQQELSIYIIKDFIHADFIFDSSFFSDLFPSDKKYIKIGWGDRKIFLETKKWKDLKIIDLIGAFFGMNKTCLRVEFLNEISNCKEIKISKNQLEIIKNYIEQSYNKKLIHKKPSYYQEGNYYESNLSYNCITNCNNWINRGLFIARVTNRIWCPITFWL